MDRTDYVIKIEKMPFEGFGCKVKKNGIYFGVVLPECRNAGIMIYDMFDAQKSTLLKLDDSFKTGNVYSFKLTGVKPGGFKYRLWADERTVEDAYARKVCGNESFGETVSADDLYFSPETGSSPVGFEIEPRLRIPMQDLVVYRAHVRGATKLYKPCKKGNGTFSGLISMIPYLKKLNVNCVELMPFYEFIEGFANDNAAGIKDYMKPLGKPIVNYWGFCKSFYYAVKSSFSQSENASAEFKKMILAFHRAGIEIVGTFSFAEDVKAEFVKDVFRFWVSEYHLDGFRLIGLKNIAKELIDDPFLSDSKLFLEIDDRMALYKDKVPLYRNIGLVNDNFLISARRFIKSDEDTVAELSYLVRENAKGYSPLRYITDFFGFTLYDITAYNYKHNELNHENNNDGTDYNYSWNMGAEGDTVKRSINKARLKQVKNALLLTLLCQGTPVIRGGDEVLNTQNGNNNPYCQDNEIGWVKYRTDKSAREIYCLTANLLAFRKRHSILHQPRELMLFDYMSCKCPDVSYHGAEAFKMDQNPVSREFGILYFGDYSKQYTGQKEASVYIIYNMNWEEREYSLPLVGKDYSWKLLYSTDGSTDCSFNEETAALYTNAVYRASGRTITVFLLSSL